MSSQEVLPFPHCIRCKVPVKWHSRQIIESNGRPEEMDIFECPECGQLTAQPASDRAA